MNAIIRAIHKDADCHAVVAICAAREAAHYANRASLCGESATTAMGLSVANAKFVAALDTVAALGRLAADPLIAVCDDREFVYIGKGRIVPIRPSF